MECAPPKLNALSPWTDCPANRQRYDLDDGRNRRPVQQRSTATTSLIIAFGFIQTCPGQRKYGHKRTAQLIADLADHIRQQAEDDGTQPNWVPHSSSLSAALIGEIAVWRAANSVDPHDRRPPDQNSCRPLRPNGNNISIEASPTRATTRPTWICGGRDLVPLMKVAVMKIDAIGSAHPRSMRGQRRQPLASEACGDGKMPLPAWRIGLRTFRFLKITKGTLKCNLP
jgi:hypothetical protein